MNRSKEGAGVIVGEIHDTPAASPSPASISWSPIVFVS
jgi:hypothetical protein